MPSIRARITRLIIRVLIGKRFEKAGQSIERWRELEDFIVRNQKPLRGTEVTAVSEGGVEGEWVHGPGSAVGGVILYLHGGGFIFGSPTTHRELASWISAAAGVPVFSLDYRLAPEHPHPAAMDDAKSAYGWLLSQGHYPDGIVIGGDSAGGGLALQTLLALKDDGITLPAAAFFMSPVTDWVALDGESYSTRSEADPLISRAQCQWTASLYSGDRARQDPLLQPLGMDLSGLPPLWIQVGEDEVLLSDAERLAGRAGDAKVQTEFKVWPGMWHVFQASARMVPEGRTSLEDLGRFVRGVFSHLRT
jgi:acetyl esterase/lipase